MDLKLKNGTILINRYEIISSLGQGGFGVAYKAKDLQKKKLVAIKEFLPSGCSIYRNNNDMLLGSLEYEEAYTEGLKRFKLEAKNLSLFKHPNIVKITDYFSSHNSSYYVMKFEHGLPLDQFLMKKNRLLNQDEIINLIFPILEGLKEMHSKKMYHRDVKPENIFITGKGMPILIDFGAARMAMINKSQKFTRILTQGYAPPEQYESTASRQGAWTDIYAVAALMYEMVVGKKPTNSLRRVTSIYQKNIADPLVYPIIQDVREFDDDFLNVIMSALSIRIDERPQTVVEFQDMMMNSIGHDNKDEEIETFLDEERQNDKEKEVYENEFDYPPFIIAVISILFLGYIFFS